ncbi:DUF2642 domain-containing protein [Bacillus sp. 'calajunan']|uniref:DUF2642 domain-containing protein n=1 Tax=Bacillus sp. 'calajunan' TaxID=3447457 RepID=UPI003EE1D17D
MSYLEEIDLSEYNMVSVPNPYVYQTLQSVIGKHVVIETVRGKLKNVKLFYWNRNPLADYILNIIYKYGE